MIKNKQEEIAEIVWRVDGKVKEIRRTSESLRKNITFDYDAMGNQIAKHIINNQTGMLERSTYYVLDAQGNQMNVYSHDVTAENVSYKLIERSIFGASILGTDNTEVDMFAEHQSTTSQVHLGHKYYSLSDHRGNVNTVIKDIKIPIELEEDDEPFEDPGDAPYFNADGTIKFDELTVHPVHTCVNPGLNFQDSPTSSYPMFEDVNADGNIDMRVRSEVQYGTFPARLFFYTTPGQTYTVEYTISDWENIFRFAPFAIDCGNVIAPNPVFVLYAEGTYTFTFTATSAQTEIKWNIRKLDANQPGEVTFSNISFTQGTGPFFSQPIPPPVDPETDISHYEVAIVSVADYSPFNVELDGRTIKNDFYRRSVQGQEHHDEILGEGNYINYKYRGYDPRIGRLDWSIDPLSGKYPWYTPYQYSGNQVIHAIELEGLEEVHVYNIWYDKNGKKQKKKSHIERDNSSNVNKRVYRYFNEKGEVYKTVEQVIDKKDKVEQDWRDKYFGSLLEFQDEASQWATDVSKKSDEFFKPVTDATTEIGENVTKAVEQVDAIMAPYKEEKIGVLKDLYSIQATLGGSGIGTGFPIGYSKKIENAFSTFDDISSLVSSWDRTKAGQKGTVEGIKFSDVLSSLEANGFSKIETRNNGTMKYSNGHEIILVRKSKTGKYSSFDTFTNTSGKSVRFKNN